MENFLERKEQYLEKTRDNPFILQAIFNDSRNKGKPILRIMLNPSSENELILAESMFTIFYDMIEITISNPQGGNEPDYDDNMFLNYMSRTMNAIKESNQSELELIKEELKTNNSPESNATIVYDMMRAFAYNYDKAVNSIAQQAGFELSDYFQIKQFEMYFQVANDQLNSFIDSKIAQETVDIEDSETINILERFTKAFDELYQRDYELGKVKKK